MEATWSFVADKQGRAIVLPDGRCDIIVRKNIHRSDPAIPVITGPSTRAYTVNYEKGDQWHGIRLRPEHGAALWRHGLVDAVDSVLRGQAAKAFLPALAALDDEPMSVHQLERVIPTPARPTVDHRVMWAIDNLHMSGGRLRVEHLAQRLSCTARHLNRLCRQNIGLSAKTYAQLVQFHRTLRLITESDISLAAAAFEGGYADQAHLTRSFRRFGGFVPSEMPWELSLPTLFQIQV